MRTAWWLLPVLLALLFGVLASSAQAYTYILRPDSTTVAGSWSIDGGATIDSVLNEAVISPAAPVTGFGYVSEVANGPSPFEVALSTVTLRGGENVTRLKSWGYAQTGDGRSMDTELRTGATPLAGGTWPVGTPASWQSATYNGTVTQAELDDLRQRRTLQGTGASTATIVYASYVEVTTDMPPSTPSISGGPTGVGQGTTATYTWTATTAAGFECRLERNGTPVSDWSSCTSGVSYDLTTWGDGDYTFRVRAVDDVGAAGAESTRLYTLDRAPPAAPSITTPPTSPGADAAPVWSFTGEAGAVLSCRLTRGATLIQDWTICSSPKSYTLGGEIDGTYTFQVHATDMAGNTGPDATGTYVLDRAAPAAPTFSSSPPSAGSATNPSWTISAEAGATLKFRLERGATVISDWATGTSPRSYDISGEVDGTYTFRVTATDAAGNESSQQVGTYTLDRVAPAAPTITGGPPADSSNASPSYSFTAEAGSATECRLTRGATIVSDWGPCVTGVGYPLGVQPDGTYLFEVRATDAAGNTGAVASRSYNLDRAAPAAPSITSGPSAPSPNATPSYSFTYEPGATAECRLERGATVISDWTACTAPNGYDISGQVDGTYTFRVRATDAAGNVGPDASRSYALDRAAPAAPTLTATPAANDSSTSPSWSFTAEAGAALKCRLERGAALISDWASCPSPKAYDLSAQVDGTYTFRVTATDAAGNESPQTVGSYVLDRVAPVAPTITTGPTGSSQNQNPSYGFTAEAGSNTECRVERGATVVGDWATCASPKSYDLSAQVDGTYTFRVRATDAAANQGPDATRTYTLDRTAPVAPTITSGPAANSNDDTPVYGFTAEAGASPTCRVTRGAANIVGWSPCSSPQGYDLSADIDGTYTFDVRVTDAAGNVGAIATRNYVLDRSAPLAPAITAAPPADSNNANPSYSFTAEAGAATDCRLTRGATVVSDWGPCVTGVSYSLGVQPDGTYLFEVRATDAANNTGPIANRSFNLDRSAPAAPVITGAPPTYSSDPAPAVSFSYEPGATASCRMERGATVVSDWTPCSSPYSYDLSAQPDGTYIWRVRATDPAGNIGSQTSGPYTLDRVAPTAPTLTGRPSALTNDDTPTWSFTGDADTVSFECRILNGSSATIYDWAPCTSPRTYDLTAKPDNTYTFYIRAVDGGGLKSPSTTDAFALDRVAPTAPTITAGPAGSSSVQNPSYSFTAEAGSAISCRIERGATVVSDWATCTSPKSYDLSLQPDAAYTFRVRTTDGAGNTGAESTRSYTLDRAAPAAPVITGGPAADSSDDTPTYDFTGEPGAAFTCRVSRAATVVVDWSPCSTPQSYNLTGEVDGGYTFDVRATDAALNTGPAASRVYNLDRVAPPAPAFTSTPGAATNSNTIAWSYTTAGGATATSCRLERNSTVVSDWAACASPKSYDVSALADGTYVVRVRASDAAGNVGAESTDTTVVDRAAPAAPTVTGAPSAFSPDDTPDYAFTAEPLAATTCRIERGATVVVDWSLCTSPATFNLVAQVDGGYTFRVRATDAAGNTGADATRSYTLDRVAPPAPPIVTRPPAATNNPLAQWGWTTDPDAASYACRITRGATVVIDWATCATPKVFDLTVQPDATYTLHVRGTDAAGNVGSETTDAFDLDRAAPAAPSITAAPAADSSDDTPTYDFTAEAGATTACRIERGATVISDWAPCAGPKSYDLSAQPDGSYTFRVRATDPAGNTGTDASRTYALDRNAPVAPSIATGPTGDSADDTPTYAFTAEAGATTECRIERGAVVVGDWAACTSPKTFTLTSEVDGGYTFRVRATDAAGNTGPAATRAYVLDRTAPAAPTITSGPAADSVDDSPTYAFTAEAGATLECRLQRGAATVSDWAPCTSPKTYDVSAEVDGTYLFSVRATDAAGNTGAAQTRSYNLDRVVPAAPSLDGSPAIDGNDRTPAYDFSTTETGRTFECRLARGATPVEDWTDCVTGKTYDLTLQPDATYTFDVRAYNAAGTRSPITSDTYRFDTAAPVAPALSSGPAPDSTDDTPSWSIAAEPGAALECRLERGATTVSDWTACTSPVGYDLGGDVDGTYTVRVRATDAAGNTSAEGTQSYNLDRTVPTTPVMGSSPPADGSDPNPSWDWTAEPGKRFECRLLYEGSTFLDWVACTSPFTSDLSGDPDGRYTFEVDSINPAGTRSPSLRDDYTLDRAAPVAPVITSGPAADSVDDTPTWGWTAEAGATFECRLERGAAAVVDWRACTDPESQDISGEVDGTYTFRVRATDAAGNTGPDASRSYNLDRTVPGPATITGRPASPGPDSAPNWAISGDAPLTMECKVTRGPDTIQDWAPCTSPYVGVLGGEPDSAYTFHLRQYNAAGTRGPEVTDDYVLDTNAPAAPVITGRPGVATNSNAPQWTFTAEAGASLECRLERGGVEVRAWGACTSPRSYGLAGEPDGDYTFSVRAIDAAGNVGASATDDTSVDRVPPAPPAITAGPGPLGKNRAVAWSFNGEPGATFECRVDADGAELEPFLPCGSPRGLDLGGKPDGPYAFGVRAVDAAGNRSETTTAPYRLDTAPGAVTIDSGPDPIGRDRAPKWTYTAEDGSSVTCRLDEDGASVFGWAPCAMPATYDLTGRPDGVFRLSLRATDAAGNEGPVADAAYELDTTPPEAPVIDAAPDSPGTDRTPSWRFSGENRATYACKIEAKTPGSPAAEWAACASPFTADLVQAPDGEYRFSVRATDRAGNTGAAATSDYEVKKAEEAPPKQEDPPAEDVNKAEPRTEPVAPPDTAEKKKSKAVPPPPVKPKKQDPKPGRKVAKPSAPAPKTEAPRRSADDKKKGGILGSAGRAVKAVARAIVDNPDKSVFPFSLILLVLGFLAIQNRIDRGDPKLALAPSFADPDLEFPPPPARA